jgi:histone-lysine N-methyltransferase SETMAR
MLIVFCGLHGIAHYCWFPKDSTLYSPFFCEEVLSIQSTRSENAAKFQRTRKPLTLIQMDNAKVHTARTTQEKLDVSRFKRTPQPPYSPNIALSDFFFSVG